MGTNNNYSFHETVVQNRTGLNGSVAGSGMRASIKRLLGNIGRQVHNALTFKAQQTGLLNAIPAQIALLNSDGIIVTVNDAWKNFMPTGTFKGLYGAVGDNYLTVARHAPGKYEAIAQQLANGITAVITGTQNDFTFEYICPTCVKETWFEARIAPIVLGRQRGAVIMHTNITAGKLAEEKIRRSEANLNAIIENTGASIYSIDTNFRFITFNSTLADSMREFFGLDVKPGDHAFQFLQKNDPKEARVWEEIYTEALSGKPLMFVKDYSRAGKPLFLSFSINPIWENKVVTGLSCLARDVTRKRLAEDELRASEQRYRHISQNPLVGIAWLSPTGKVLNANEAFCNMLGYTNTEVIDAHFSKYTHPEDSVVQQQVMDELLTGKGESFETEKRYLKKNGDVMWGKVILSSVKNDLGEVKYIIGVMHDISATKKMEAELVALNGCLEQKIKERTAELELANRELESFSYTVSHDLQAPLRVVDGYSKIMLKEYGRQLDEKGNENLVIIGKMARRMSQLVKDLLAFAKGGKATITKSEVEMNDLVNTIVEEIKISNPDFNHHLKIGTLPPAYCDAGLMKQVWANLIGNAIKYSKNKEGAVIEIGHKIINGRGTYYIQDNGVGFDMKHIDRLFAAFQRLHTHEEFEGTGVGLATVHRIITYHGGSIWAEAKVNHGATFYFILPQPSPCSAQPSAV